jgi:hypothetical protein
MAVPVGFAVLTFLERDNRKPSEPLTHEVLDLTPSAPAGRRMAGVELVDVDLLQVPAVAPA